jgi:hypothetical protein
MPPEAFKGSFALFADIANLEISKLFKICIQDF